jgi:RNA polymerase sigma-70 factor (ECF subfamily)
VDSPTREQQWTSLLERSIEGDSGAYRELLVRLTVALRKIVRSRAQAAGLDPEDVVQEVLLALHLKRGTWEQGTPVAPWVAAIARNKIIDALRRRGQRTEIPIDSVVETLVTDARTDEDSVHDLENVLAHLNPRQRAVVRTVSLEGHSSQEAAALLRMSEGAVRVALHRSLKTLAGIFRAVPSED